MLLGVFAMIMAFGCGIAALVHYLQGRPLAGVSRATVTPLVAAHPGQHVTVKGRVLPREQGYVVSALSGRPAVALRMTALEYGGRSGRRTFADESVNRCFDLDDGSGRRVLVDPQHARISVVQPAVADDNPAVLESRDVPRSTLAQRLWAGERARRPPPKSVRILERRVEPHAIIFAVGTLGCDEAGQWRLSWPHLVPHDTEEIERALRVRSRRALGIAAAGLLLAAVGSGLFALVLFVDLRSVGGPR